MLLKVGSSILVILVILVVINIILVYALQNEKKKKEESQQKIEEIESREQKIKQSYEKSIASLLSERASERAATADLIDSLKKIQDSKNTIINSISEAEKNDEGIKDYLDTAIPDELSILLKNPLTNNSNRVCDSESSATSDDALHLTSAEGNEDN